MQGVDTAQRWGHATVRLHVATCESDPTTTVGTYAEVQRGCRTEVFRDFGEGGWWRVDESMDDLRAKDSALIRDAEPQDVDGADTEALHHLLDQVELARQIATRDHAGQTDKASRPYIDHPRRVAARLVDLQAQAVAWLHDVIEDTATTADDLRGAGIDDEVVAAVELLTRTGDDADYYARIAADPIARDVKLADIADNTDPARTALLDPETRQRLAEKYTHARRALGALEEDA